MKHELVVREQRPYELTEKQVTIIANTEFVPKEKRGKLDVIWASIFKGRSIGVDDFTAINEIHVVNGTPGLSAALAAGIARKRGHLIDGKLSAAGAVAHGKRADNGAEMTVSFGPEEAQQAGLAGKTIYKQHPQSMYWARAVTQLCRSLFSDCFVGGVYTPEELGADFVPDDDVIDVTGEEVTIEAQANTDTPAAEPEPDAPFAAADDAAKPTTWDELKDRAAAEGIGDDVRADAGSALFAGRNPSDLDADEIGRLWDAMVERSSAAATA